MATGADVRAGGAFVEFYAKGDAAVQKALADMQAATKQLGKALVTIGASVAGGGAAITAPFLFGLSVASERVSELGSASRRTGIPMENLGSLAYALSTDVDTLAGVTRKMNSVLNDAAHGSEEANRQLAELGLTFEELNGLNTEQRLSRIADALNGIRDAGQRLAVQKDVFGRGAMALNIGGGSAGIAGRQARGRSLGADMSRDDIAAVRQYNAAQRDLGVVTKAIWSEIGAIIAPVMTEMVQRITTIVQAIRAWVKDNRPLLDVIFRIADSAVIVGGILAALGGVIIGLSFSFSLLGSIAGAVFGGLKFLTLALTAGLGINTVAWLAYKIVVWAATFATLILSKALAIATGGLSMLWTAGLLPFILGVGIAYAVILGLVYVLPMVWETWLAGMGMIWQSLAGVRGAIASTFSGVVSTLREMFVGLFGTIMTTFGGIMDFLQGGDMEGAFRILMAGLNVAWLQIVIGMRASWIQLVEGMKVIWGELKVWFLQAVNGMWTGMLLGIQMAFYAIKTAWSNVVEWMRTIWSQIMETVNLGIVRILFYADPRNLALSASQRDGLLESELRTVRMGAANDRRRIGSEGTADRVVIDQQEAGALANAFAQEARVNAAIVAANRVQGRDPEQDPAVRGARQDLLFAQAELDTERIVAEMSAQSARDARAQNATNNQEGFQNAIGQTKVQGTFNSAAVSGFFGGTAADRQQALAEEQRTLQQQMRDLLQRIADRDGLAFA